MKGEQKNSELIRLSGLNDSIEVNDIDYDSARNLIVICKCKICGNVFKKLKPQYEINPHCPECSKNKPRTSIQWTNESWIAAAKEIHPEYDLSETVYINSHTPITYVCPKHGKRNASPKVFIKENYCCPECKLENRIKKDGEKCLSELKEKFPEYDFSKAIYTGKKKEMVVICPIHGEFNVSPYRLMSGAKCPKCSIKESRMKQMMPNDEFKRLSVEVHGDKYTYDKVDMYNKDSKGRVCITCPRHGDFWQTPYNHLSGQGCARCHSNNRGISRDELIEDFKKVHGDKYDYSEFELVNMTTPGKFICHCVDQYTGKEHGVFIQTPKNHLRGFGCKKCSGNYMDLELLKAKATSIHNGVYLYDRINEYPKNNKELVEIGCMEHGYFRQRINSHLSGQGCPLCKTSHIECEMKIFLTKNNIKHTYQYRDKDIFGRQSIDFFLNDLNIAIECQGEEHFIASYFKSKGEEFAENHLKLEKERDERKRIACVNNGIRLIYFINKKFEKFMKDDFEYYCDYETLLNAILKM